MLCRALGGALALLALVASIDDAADARGNRWGAGYFPDALVTTQDGKTLHFYDDLIKGRTVVVSFIYTSCTELCPIETARLAEVKDRLGDAVGRDVFFVSLTVDPEHDTPAMLKAFAEAFDAKAPAWQFVTGQPDDIKAINAKFGDRSAERDLSSHRNEVLIGNDSTGDWQRDSTFDDVDQLVMTIRLMDPKFRNAPGAASAAAGGYLPLSNEPGQALFQKMCAPCHTIGGGRRVGPDLAGVTDRRDHGWLIDFITNPPQMLARKDPAALALATGYPGVRMPVMGLGASDAADLISYLHDQTARLAPAVEKGDVTVPTIASKEMGASEGSNVKKSNP